MRSTLRLALLSISILSLGLIVGCTQEEQNPQAAGPKKSSPAVTVAKVVNREISEWKEFTGRLEAEHSIVVMPRTSGYVVSVNFEDGAKVKKGDTLFQIDYAVIRAEVAQLEADVKRAEASIELAERDLKRAESLRTKNAVSQEQLDNTRTRLTQARAEAESARADLQRSRILDAITTVKAEFNGRVSNARVKVGSAAIGGSTVLTTLVSTEKVHAYFDVDEQTYAHLRKLAKGKALEDMGIPVFMALFGEDGYEHLGKIDFVDNQIDVATGTIRLRAVFDNQNDQFTPGMFARLKMRVSDNYEGILVDEKAIGTDLSHKYVLVLDEENKVQYRPVTLGPRIEGLRAIRSGLKAGESIVIRGLQRVRPGTPVTPTEEEMAPSAQLDAISKLQQQVSGSGMSEDSQVMANHQG